MVQLRDRAGQLVHHLSSRDVNKANGLEVIMNALEKSPIIRQLDRHKVDQRRKKLMQLRRLPGESQESYVTRGSIYRTQLQALDKEMQMGECFYTGHLLNNAKLTRRDKVMIKTRAGSDYEEDITNVMIELAPELEGEHGFPIGSSEPNAAARHGDDFLIQRDLENGSLAGIEEEGPGLDEEACPPELDDAENEAFAMHFKVKQKIAEVRKLRQYFKRPDQEEKKKLLAEKMRTSPCHRCGELGHWSRECPQKGPCCVAIGKCSAHHSQHGQEPLRDLHVRKYSVNAKLLRQDKAIALKEERLEMHEYSKALLWTSENTPVGTDSEDKSW